MKPSVGRIVHYVSYGTPGGEFVPEHRAAIIAAVPDGVKLGTVDLVVFNPQGLFFNRCEHDEEWRKGGTWHWPERAPEDISRELTIDKGPALR